MVFLRQGGESSGCNDRVHGISCRYSVKACKKIYYISTNTYCIFSSPGRSPGSAIALPPASALASGSALAKC